MKKILKNIFFIPIIITLLGSCSALGDFTQSFFGEKLVNLTPQEVFERNMRSYKLEAEIKTTKGTINVILYPDAAPLNVAHFVYLANKGFYDGMKFHRVIVSGIIQTGDNKGDGTGNSGSFQNDEFVNWLDFKNTGMLAMANSGPNTNSSQIFITLSSFPQYNKKYTIIGELKSRDDLSIARLIRRDDKIINIKITGVKVNTFLDNFKDEIKKWENQ